MEFSKAAYQNLIKFILIFICITVVFYFLFQEKGYYSLNYPEYFIIEATNRYRKENSLEEVEINFKLHACAKKYAYKMAQKNTLSHSLDSTLSERVSQEGYVFSYIGENIAYGYDYKKVVDGWMNSSGHRANILNSSYNEIGVGMAYSSDGTPYYCQVFGRK